MKNPLLLLLGDTLTLFFTSVLYLVVAALSSLSLNQVSKKYPHGWLTFRWRSLKLRPLHSTLLDHDENWKDFSLNHVAMGPCGLGLLE